MPFGVYTSTLIDDKERCLGIMKKMEEEYKTGSEDYFIKVLKEESSLVLRVHAVTILAELGRERSVEALSDVLLNDPDPLVRHEAAFSMGQIGLSSANKALIQAMLHDPDAIVRHESAAALGSIGSQSSRTFLEQALGDPDEIVKNSAATSLFNLEFLRNNPEYQQVQDRAPRP